jgi:hypothetical protein
MRLVKKLRLLLILLFLMIFRIPKKSGDVMDFGYHKRQEKEMTDLKCRHKKKCIYEDQIS